MEAPRDYDAALDALPLFPLPTVLFPEAILPLHVFEPRYRKMTRDVIEGAGAMAVVFVTDASAVDEYNHPKIASIATVGTVVDYAELPGGRFNLLLRGRSRVELEELPFLAPYRRAKARVLATTGDVSAIDRAALVAAATGFAARMRERDPDLELVLPKDAPGGVVADLCANQLLLDPRERQAVLEIVDASARARRVTEVLTMQRLALGGDRRDMN